MFPPAINWFVCGFLGDETFQAAVEGRWIAAGSYAALAILNALIAIWPEGPEAEDEDPPQRPKLRVVK